MQCAYSPQLLLRLFIGFFIYLLDKDLCNISGSLFFVLHERKLIA